MEQQQSTRISKEQIPFEKLEKVGINKDFVDRMESKELKDFLNGFRSDKLYTVNAKINDQDYRIPAKIRLKQENDGSVDVKIHPIQRLHIPDEYMGHKFTKEDKAALLNDKNLGKIVELTGKGWEKRQLLSGHRQQDQRVDSPSDKAHPDTRKNKRRIFV